MARNRRKVGLITQGPAKRVGMLVVSNPLPGRAGAKHDSRYAKNSRGGRAKSTVSGPRRRSGEEKRGSRAAKKSSEGTAHQGEQRIEKENQIHGRK